MNAPLKSPPKRHFPVLVPAPREMLVADYYGQEVHLDGPAWQRNDFAHPEFRLDWTTLEFTHRGMIEATADFFVDLLSTSASVITQGVGSVAA